MTESSVQGAVEANVRVRPTPPPDELAALVAALAREPAPVPGAWADAALREATERDPRA